MERYRDGELKEGAFSKDDLHKAFGKFEYARKMNSKLKDVYEEACLKNGQVSRKNARYCLLAWMKQPDDVEACLKSMTKIAGSEGACRESDWLTEKQLVDMYGQEEVEEMIENDLLVSRANPLNPRRKQYSMVVKDVTYQKVSKGKTLEVKNQSKVDGKTALALTTSMEGLKFARLRSACKDMGLDFQDALKDPEFKALQLFLFSHHFLVLNVVEIAVQ